MELAPPNTLQHYGVKGMKWGVRKDRDRAASKAAKKAAKAAKKAKKRAEWDTRSEADDHGAEAAWYDAKHKTNTLYAKKSVRDRAAKDPVYKKQLESTYKTISNFEKKREVDKKVATGVIAALTVGQLALMAPVAMRAGEKTLDRMLKNHK